jgi:hypothetical protein
MLTMGINSFGAVWMDGVLFGEDESGVMSEAKRKGLKIREKETKEDRSFLSFIKRLYKNLIFHSITGKLK